MKYLLFILLAIALSLATVRAIDIYIENQDIMLCKSAKVSGNAEYLEKCECWYKGQDIKCLQGEVKGASADIVVERINNRRLENNLLPVKINEKLNKSAEIKACDLRDRNYWSHTTPDGQAFTFAFKKAGYYWKKAGENLAHNIGDGEVVDRWMVSETHRAIILTGYYKEVGIGRCGDFIVAHFGTR